MRVGAGKLYYGKRNEGVKRHIIHGNGNFKLDVPPTPWAEVYDAECM